MDAKEFLSRGFLVNEQIAARKRELEQLREIACSPGASDLRRSRIKSKAKIDYLESLIVSIDDLEEQILSEIAEYLEWYPQARKLIMSVRDSKKQIVLHKRYLLAEQWSDIADELQCTVRHVLKQNSDALIELSGVKTDDQ